MGVSLSQPVPTRSMVVFTRILFLADFAGGGAFDIADDALAVFYFQSHDAEAVEGNDGLFGLLGCSRAAEARRVGRQGWVETAWRRPVSPGGGG